MNVIINPNFQNNPKAQLIIDKILVKTGQLSPLELSDIETSAPSELVQPTSSPTVATPSGGEVGATSLLNNQ